MKPTGFHLLSFVVAGSLAAQEAAPAGPAKTSGRLKTEIRTSLPAYVPPPPKALDQPKDAETGGDPDLLSLPTVTVREKRVQRIEPNDLLSPGDLRKKYAADYKRSLKGLDAVLNSFTIPIISAPISLRDPSALAVSGRELYRSGQYEDIRHVIAAGKSADPRNAGSLADEQTDLQLALDWQDRPAGGGGRKK